MILSFHGRQGESLSGQWIYLQWDEIDWQGFITIPCTETNKAAGIGMSRIFVFFLIYSLTRLSECPDLTIKTLGEKKEKTISFLYYFLHFVFFSIFAFYLSIYLSIYLYIYLFTYLFIKLSFLFAWLPYCLLLRFSSH